MNKYFLSIIVFFVSFATHAQSPNGFKYQAVLRDLNNAIVAQKNITLTIRIIQGDENNTPLYSEVHDVLTSASGLFSVDIGKGASADRFDEIVWSDGPYFVRILIDGVVFSTSQLMSVPYSMHATTAEKIESFNVSEAGDTLLMNGQKYVVPGISARNTKAFKNQKVLGGTSNENVKFFSKAKDGGYWLGGTTQSFNGDVSGNHGAQDIWIVKLNSDKSIVWQSCIGGSAYETFSQLIETSDGGCIVGGTTESSDGDIVKNQGDFDILLAKISSTGVVNWVETYGGGNTDFLNHISETSGGGILVGATTFSIGGDILKNHGDADIWIFQLDGSHKIVKQKSIGGLQYDALKKMQINANGTYTVYAITESNDGNVQGNNGAMDMWVANLNADFEVTSQICIGGANNDELLEVESKSTNLMVLGGLTFASDWDPYNSKKDKNIKIIELNTSLSIERSKQLGGSHSENLKRIIPLANGELVVFAESTSKDGDVVDNKGDQDQWLFVLSSSFELSKSLCIGGSYMETLGAAVPLLSGGYLVAGTSESVDGDISGNHGMADIVVMQLDENLHIVNSRTFGGTYNEGVMSIIA